MCVVVEENYIGGCLGLHVKCHRSALRLRNQALNKRFWSRGAIVSSLSFTASVFFCGLGGCCHFGCFHRRVLGEEL